MNEIRNPDDPRDEAASPPEHESSGFEPGGEEHEAAEARERIVAFCRTCGAGLTAETERRYGGTVYCEQHAPAMPGVPGKAASAAPPIGEAPAPPWNPPAPEAAPPPRPATGVSPGLAFLLGLIPGVGAIYNEQYAKGIIHVVVFGFLISMAEASRSGAGPLFGMLIAVWFFYMPFEAYHTAKKRQAGIPVDEFSSLLPMKAAATGSTIGPILLIVLGVVFLFDTLEILNFRQFARYWPVLLIALGAYLLWARLNATRHSGHSFHPEAHRE